MITLNFMHLQCFVSAAESGSFSAAARELGKAQSGVSTAVANLEVDLGVALFSRSKKYLELTDAGKVLLQEAKVVLKGGERLIERAMSYHQHDDTHIRVVLDEALYPLFITTVLTEFEKRFPYTELDLISGVFSDVEHYVASGKADIGLLISTGIPRSVNDYTLLSYIPFQAAVSASHSLAEKEGVTLNDLAETRQIIVTSQQNKDSEVTHISQRNWLAPSYHHCADLVSQQVGWAFFPVCALDIQQQHFNLVPLSLDVELKEHASPLYLIKNTHSSLGNAGQWLLKALQKLV
ncbi:LysR family transcriptional regulator [Vibrio sp. EA2]|uniref:LysR family transcriptional regulator n=1 Tax=Vibrio sp. EA2 TaxID=3079860 RepID=UPI002949517D|nr:LysR family transcriptional regulator [Vibrio sp. EA2]MDV6253462.1 LysR family transcriptional regulator [Vibrio sp. EA2]